MTKAGFTRISFDAYVDLHMRSNPEDMARDEVVSVLRSALAAHNNGTTCHCGNPIWVIGSAFVGNACFTCITGEASPDGDYEIDEAM
ncbi:MAG: hypothetical protein ACYTEK_22475 [Planctomycetota bacterium]|jgi:hypothetical protein